ncbi:MAG: phosphoenolpyruvate--protein phosphotransferase, partial [Oxalobacter sp.]|nr:phosphoenolpyruvate--protein phosphotransferase [Oxalobacter sp.]
GIPVSICGEVAGDPALTRLLLGMGLREFSMHPAQLLNVKQAILSSDVTLLKPKVDKILTLVEENEIEEAVRQLQDDAKTETDA